MHDDEYKRLSNNVTANNNDYRKDINHLRELTNTINM